MPRSNTPRVIILIDMDCFYAGVEQRERPELRGKPVVVVQGHEFKGGGIIAVSYEARTFGVTRMMRANEAVAKCPELAVCYVPVRHGKADLTRYRNVCAEIIKIISRFADKVERASVDEAFVDVTEAVQKRLAKGDIDLHSFDKVSPLLPNTHVAGYPAADTKTRAVSSAETPSTTDVPRGLHPQAASAAGSADATRPGVFDTAAWSIGVGGQDPDEDGYCDELLDAEVGGDGVPLMDVNDPADPADPVRSSADGDGNGGGADTPTPLSSVDSLRAWHDQSRDEQSLALLVGAVIASEMRQAVSTEASVSCSAGVAQNKVLAKLACGLHKPAQQTVLPFCSVPDVFADLPFKKVRNLGGGFGKTVQQVLKVKSVGEVAAFSAVELERHFGDKMGPWLYDICRGVCHEPVRERRLAQSLGSSKNFPGPKKLTSHEQIRYWLLQYSKELVERVRVDEEMNDRRPSHLSVHALHEGEDKPLARSCQWSVFSSELQLMEKAYALLISSVRPRPPNLGPESEQPGPSPWSPGVVNVGMCADQFKSVKATKNMANIAQFFQQPSSTQSTAATSASAAVATKPSSTDNACGMETCESVSCAQPSQSVSCDQPSQTKHPLQDSLSTECDDVVQATKGGAIASTVTSTCGGQSTKSVIDMLQQAPAAVQPLAACSTASGVQPDNTTSSSSCDWQRCDQCSKMVSAWDLPEHLDFHFAQSLQTKERSTMRETNEARRSSLPGPAAKRTKMPQQKRRKSSGPSGPPINSYFSKGSPSSK
eukprot:scpid38683/ scgid14972/ DNA polymerase eta; RAD30 homolog A; Xeroderma pigmentosum variant type protein